MVATRSEVTAQMFVKTNISIIELYTQILLVKTLKITTHTHSSELYDIDWQMTIEHLKYLS